jgi:hypothetical protein
VLLIERKEQRSNQRDETLYVASRQRHDSSRCQDSLRKQRCGNDGLILRFAPSELVSFLINLFFDQPGLQKKGQQRQDAGLVRFDSGGVCTAPACRYLPSPATTADRNILHNITANCIIIAPKRLKLRLSGSARKSQKRFRDTPMFKFQAVLSRTQPFYHAA